MSSLLTSQGMALATAMAVSGTVIILALCRHQKPLFDARFAVDSDSPSPARTLRSCIASGERKLRRSKKKRVHFADHLVEAVELIADDEDTEQEDEDDGEDYYDPGSGFEGTRVSRDDQAARMPPNRLALYHGMLQDRLQRMACSY